MGKGIENEILLLGYCNENVKSIVLAVAVAIYLYYISVVFEG